MNVWTTSSLYYSHFIRSNHSCQLILCWIQEILTTLNRNVFKTHRVKPCTVREALTFFSSCGLVIRGSRVTVVIWAHAMYNRVIVCCDFFPLCVSPNRFPPPSTPSSPPSGTSLPSSPSAVTKQARSLSSSSKLQEQQHLSYYYCIMGLSHLWQLRTACWWFRLSWTIQLVLLEPLGIWGEDHLEVKLIAASK